MIMAKFGLPQFVLRGGSWHKVRDGVTLWLQLWVMIRWW